MKTWVAEFARDSTEPDTEMCFDESLFQIATVDLKKIRRLSRFLEMSQLLCIIFLLLTCCAPSAQTEEHRVRNIVLVHGAWADGSGWKGVHDILIKDGYNVSIVQEPETSFKDDVAATKRVLALQDGPSILVAHSYGGAVITEAGTDSSVAGLVYVAAHMPDAGFGTGATGSTHRADGDGHPARGSRE
jgi:pimeloyl-ACP methyl ester carboxylesterase